MELNDENVMNIYRECLAIEDDPAQDIYEAAIYMQNIEQGTTRFSKNRLEGYKKILAYLIGQFKVTHDPNIISLYSIDHLSLNYRGILWSVNPYSIFVFPHLTRYFNWNTPIIKLNEKYYIHTRIKDFSPTLSPMDPNFPQWWTLNEEKWNNWTSL